MNRDYQADLDRRFDERLAEIAAQRWNDYAAHEQKRRQMLPSDLDRMDAADRTARANQGNYADERRLKCMWRAVAILASACFVSLCIFDLFFR